MERHLDGLPPGEPLRLVVEGPAAGILRGHHRGIRQKDNEYRNSHDLIVAPAVLPAGDFARRSCPPVILPELEHAGGKTASATAPLVAGREAFLLS
jgi:hypothetical protein